MQCLKYSHLHGSYSQVFVFQYKHLKANCDPHVVIEGKDCDDWLCIDLGKHLISTLGLKIWSYFLLVVYSKTRISDPGIAAL